MTRADITNHNILPPPLAVSEVEAARLIGVSARTLFNWRASGTGPRAVRAGSRVLYAVDELRRWLAAVASPVVQANAHPAEQGGSPPEGGGE